MQAKPDTHEIPPLHKNEISACTGNPKCETRKKVIRPLSGNRIVQPVLDMLIIFYLVSVPSRGINSHYSVAASPFEHWPEKPVCGAKPISVTSIDYYRSLCPKNPIKIACGAKKAVLFASYPFCPKHYDENRGECSRRFIRIGLLQSLCQKKHRMHTCTRCFSIEATPRIELGIRVLQTRALPLGHVAICICDASDP